MLARLTWLAGFAALLLASSVRGQEPPDQPAAAQRVAVVAAMEGPIGPATLRHVERVLAEAGDRNAAIVVFRINTPGGLATSMREIIVEILRSPAPVAGFVAPAGAHAASAGTYILYAMHVAAMAPGTNLGAATPIQIGGFPPGLPSPEDEPPGKPRPGDDPSDEDGANGGGPRDEEQAPPDAGDRKAINDAVAFIRSLAEMHGRNADWAESAVREAASLSAGEAVNRGVVDLVANDIPELLDRLDGRTVSVAGVEETLRTRDIPVVTIEPDLMTRVLAILSNPNVALILMMVGLYGLIFEFANPGSIGPGVIGAISLVLGLYALNQLPIDYAGLALIALGIAFMVAEALTPSLGVLGIGGLVAFVIGAAMLIDTDAPEYQVSWPVIAVTAATSGALLVVLLGYVWRSHRRPIVSGRERLIGAAARVLDWSERDGYVRVQGERWHARGDRRFAPGDVVTVRAMEGLTLVVDARSGQEGATESDNGHGKAEGGDGT